MSKLQDRFSQACQFHRSGRIHEAISLYVKILEKQRHNAQLMFMLGTAYLQIGQTKQGVEQLQRSLLHNPGNLAGHYNLGVALNKLKRPNEALASLDHALAIKPDYAEAHNHRGMALAVLGRMDEALSSFRQAVAIRPNYAEAYNNQGNALTVLKRLDEALPCYDQALAINPGYAEAYNSRGNALANLGRSDDALTSFDRALIIKPDHVDAHYNRGNVLAGLKRFDEALASYERALALKPDYAEAFNNCGNVFRRLKRPEQAMASYDRALAIKPDYAEAHNNQGNALMDLGCPEEALTSFERALVIKPDYAEAYNNRGNALRDLTRPEEALASYDQAVAIKPDYVEAYWNKSLLLLLIGAFPEGWELYEWRYKRDDFKNDYSTFSQPFWRGQADIQGKRLLVQSEQGLGDVIQFCRYLPQLKAQGAEIIFEVPQPLVSFVSTMHCPMTVVTKGNPLPEFDAHCPLMSLPYVFKTTADTIPASIPYLFSDPGKVQQWRQRLGGTDKLRVGLVWSGSMTHKNDMNRSIQLEELLPLMDLPVEWHSLQLEYRQPDLAVLEEHPQIRQHQDELTDFADTAALIDSLDLMVSVDTSAAHVAGALGKPLWILLPYSPDYRWMLEREDSPWYPTAKLYRQSEAGDWRSVIRQVRSELNALVEK